MARRGVVMRAAGAPGRGSICLFGTKRGKVLTALTDDVGQRSGDVSPAGARASWYSAASAADAGSARARAVSASAGEPVEAYVGPPALLEVETTPRRVNSPAGASRESTRW